MSVDAGFLYRWFYEDFIGVFVLGFTLNLPLVLIGTFCLAMVVFRSPRILGLPHLFFPSSRRQRFTIGLGIGCVLWQVLLAGYMTEPFATNFTIDRPPFCDMQPPAYAGDPYAYNNSPTRKRLVALNEIEAKSGLRFKPASIFTVFRYAWAVFTASLFACMIACALWFVWRLVFHKMLWGVWHRLWFGGHHMQPPLEPAQQIPQGLRLPARSWLIGGSVLGILLTAGLTNTLWQTKRLHGISERFGMRIVKLAGWHEQDARKEYVNEVVLKGTMDKNHNPIALEASTYYKEKAFSDVTSSLKPYFPVIGAFYLNFIVIVSFYLISLIEKYLVSHRSYNSTPASGLMYIFQWCIALYMFAWYASPAPHLVVLLIGFLVIGSGVPFKLKFRNISRQSSAASLMSAYASPFLLRKYSRVKQKGIQLSSSEIAFRSKDGIVLPDTPKRPMAIVCVSGGGSRAAAWTMRILTEIERQFEEARRKPEAADKVWAKFGFPYDIRLMTGASGGMVSAALYAASLRAPHAGSGEVCRVPVQPRFKYVGENKIKFASPTGSLFNDWSASDYLNNCVRQDFLTPLAQSLTYADLVSTLLPFALWYDRGQAVEDAWDCHFNKIFRSTFGQLREGERAGWRPSLILSPMTVEDGRQLFICNPDLSKVTENHSNVLRGKSELNSQGGRTGSLLSREGREFFKLFPDSHQTFQLGTAVRMSASFPYLMSAVELPTSPSLRVVDAGFYDNFGVGIAASWLFTHMEWVKNNCTGVVVIQIRDGVSEDARVGQKIGITGASGPLGKGLDWLTAPVEGLTNFRSQSMAFRNDNLLHLLRHYFRESNLRFSDDFFQTVVFELACGDEVSLNWTLTNDECQKIDRDADLTSIQERISALREWWINRPTN